MDEIGVQRMSVLELPKIDEPSTDDPEEVAHIVMPAAAATEAYVLGIPVTALCGYTWVPHRDPEQLPVCRACKAIWDAVPD